MPLRIILERETSYFGVNLNIDTNQKKLCKDKSILLLLLLLVLLMINLFSLADTTRASTELLTTTITGDVYDYIYQT